MLKIIKRITSCVLSITIIALITISFNPLPISEVEADDSTPTVTVGNATAVASSAALNSGNAITLNENSVKSVTVTGTVTDNNSCKDLTSVKIAVYKDGTTCAASGDADADDCYWYEDTTPDTDVSCVDSDDTNYVVSQNFDIQFYADGGNWKTTITPSDEGAGTANTSALVVLNDLQSLNVANIDFGTVAAGANSTGDHTSTVTNTGNVAIDFKLSGGALTCAAPGRGTVPLANQEYALATFTYGTGGTTLTGAATDVDAVLGVPESETSGVITDDTYWQCSVPNGTEGTCTGTTTFTVRAVLP